jgi:lysozyme family protein
MNYNWEKAISLVLANEGGYVNNPNDPGGETNFGISKRSYPNEDIKNMTKERAVQIYKANYWDKVKGDQLPDKIDIAVFDCGVNCGTSTAIKLLQTAIGTTADGIIGPKTLTAASKAGAYKKFLSAWLYKYYSIVKAKPTQETFLKGWFNRVLNTIFEIG